VASGDDGHYYALAPKLPVRRHERTSLAGDPAEYRNVGAAVARMHLSLAQCPYGIESGDVRPPALPPETWRQLKSGLSRALFDELVERIKPWQDAIEACVDDPSPQRVHGDVHGGNILIADDHTVSGIIDIDHLPIAPRIYDLGYYQMFGIEWAYGRGESADTIEHATALVAQNLITGYHSVAPLTAREIDALPAMALYTAIGLICFFLRTEGSVGRTWIDTARWITDHPDALRPHTW
jgi:Ser/Thr protein kinase RdoA (MazF antagonist)